MAVDGIRILGNENVIIFEEESLYIIYEISIFLPELGLIGLLSLSIKWSIDSMKNFQRSAGMLSEVLDSDGSINHMESGGNDSDNHNYDDDLSEEEDNKGFRLQITSNSDANFAMLMGQSI